MSDAEMLAGWINVWKQAVDDFVAVLAEIPEAEWSTPTALPGWDVHAVVAHVAHLEALLAGARHEDVAIGEPEHVKSSMGTFTEQGVVARRGHTKEQLLDEIRRSVEVRARELDAAPPTDATAKAPHVFGAIGWDQRTLLRNRPLDVWMHEQDVRRAVGRPGNLDGPGARHCATYLLESLGVVVAKRAGCPAGTSVVVEVDGVGTHAVLVDDNGRAQTIEPPADPTVHLAMDVAEHTQLAGGRARPTGIRVAGDAAVAEQVLAAMAVTP